MVKRALYRLSVDEYDRMIEHGILTENHNVELIRGEVVPKMSIGPPHSGCVRRLNKVLGKLVGEQALLGIQDPLGLADSEPEPDLMLLVPRDDEYSTSNPQPSDVLLVVEVSDTSLDYDRDVKGPLYAENAIVEFWIVNLVEDCVEVHRDPRPDGTYATIRKALPGESITLALLPTVSLDVAEILA